MSKANGTRAAKPARGSQKKSRPKRGGGQLYENKGARGTTWGLRFVAPNGKRKYEKLGQDYGPGAIDRREAEELAERLLAKVRLGQYETREERRAREEAEAAAAGSMPVFAVFAAEWLARRRAIGGHRDSGLSESGERDLTWRLGHLHSWFGGMRLDEIDEREIDRFMAAKRAAPVRGGGLGATSVNKVVACLRAVLKDAHRYGLINRNPAEDARVPAAKYKAAYLDRASQIAALLDAAGKLDGERRGRRGHGRALLATLVYAGLRISEALDLTWADVDLARGELRVRVSKTDAGVRTVGLLAPLRDDLAELRARRPSKRDELIFATRTGGKESAPNVRTRLLAKAVEEANKVLVKAGEEPISERLTPHGLRHTYASLLVALGEDPSYVMDQLGHEDASFTLNIYAKAMKRRDGEKARLRALVEGTAVTVADVLAAADSADVRAASGNGSERLP